MTPLIALSIGCAAFIVGFSLGLAAFAIVWQYLNAPLDEEDTGAPEGALPIGQDGSSPV